MTTPKFIIICERAFTAAGTNNLSLINVFTEVHANAFPFTHPQFALVVNFDTVQAGSHTLRTTVLGPDGAQVAATDLPVTTTAGNWQVIANFEQFRFPSPGTYRFRLALDDTSLGERALEVKAAPVQATKTPAIA